MTLEEATQFALSVAKQLQDAQTHPISEADVWYDLAGDCDRLRQWATAQGDACQTCEECGATVPASAARVPVGALNYGSWHDKDCILYVEVADGDVAL